MRLRRAAGRGQPSLRPRAVPERVRGPVVSAAYVVRNLYGSGVQSVGTRPLDRDETLLSVLRRTTLDRVAASARLRRMEVGDRVTLAGRPNGPSCGVERVA